MYTAISFQIMYLLNNDVRFKNKKTPALPCGRREPYYKL